MSKTASEIAKFIEAALPELAPFEFYVKYKNPLGNHEHMTVTFAMSKRGGAELDALNSKKQAMISILPAAGHAWPIGETAPSKLTAYQFRGRDMKFRKKTGSLEQILKAIVDFFAVHGPYTLPQGK